MKSYGGITYRYLKGQWKRTVLTVVGIVLSVALITAIGTMFVSMREAMIRQAVTDIGDYHAQFSNVPGALVDKIRNSVDISSAAVLTKEDDAVISKVSDKERSGGGEVPPYRYFKMRSYDESTLKMFSIPLTEGRLPQAPDELVIDSWVLDYLPGHPKLGDTIKLDLGTRYDGNSNTPMEEYKLSRNEVFKKKTEREFTIVGITKSRIELSRNYLANGITYLNSQNILKDKNYEVYVKMASIKNVKPKAEAIAQTVGLEKQPDANGSYNYPIQYNDKLLRLYGQSSNDSINNALLAISVFTTILVIVATVAVIYNAFNISVLERISQFGVLRCVGASPGQIRNIVFQEAGTLSMLGVPIGLVCGVLASNVIMVVIHSLGSNALVFFREGSQAVVSLPVLIGSALLGIVTVYLSAWGPARQAGRISPLEAVRNTGSYKKENFKKVRKSRFAKLFFGIEGQMAYKNLRRNRKRYRITIFSMVISIVLYVVFGTLLNYTFESGAIRDGANADFVLSVMKDVNGSITANQYEEIKKLPGVDRIYKDMSTSIVMGVPEDKMNPRFSEIKKDLLQTKLDGLTLYSKGKLMSYGEGASPDIQKNLKGKSLDSMNKENGVILVTTSRIYDPASKKNVTINAFNYQIGDLIRISTNSSAAKSTVSQFKTVKVMGILEKDFLSNSITAYGDVYLITTDEVYQNITGNNQFRQMAIRLDKGADRQPVAQYLKKFTDQNPVYEYVDVSQVMEKLRNTAITISIFLYGFVGVVALIGCLNIINTISTNLILRTKELSILKAVGMTQNGVKKLVCLEGMLYGIISAVYGGIIGVGLSYLLYKMFMDITEFEWHMPWVQIGTASLGAILIALISGYIPLKRINKGNIVEHIRTVE